MGACQISGKQNTSVRKKLFDMIVRKERVEKCLIESVEKQNEVVNVEENRM